VKIHLYESGIFSLNLRSWIRMASHNSFAKIRRSLLLHFKGSKHTQQQCIAFFNYIKHIFDSGDAVLGETFTPPPQKNG